MKPFQKRPQSQKQSQKQNRAEKSLRARKRARRPRRPAMSEEIHEDPESQTVGGFRTIGEVLPRVLASMPEQFSPHSATTGEPSQEPEVVRPTGMQLGGTGAVATLSSDLARLKPFGLPERQGATLAPLLARLLVWGEASRFSEYGFEGVAITDVAVCAGAARAEVQEALDKMNFICCPAPST